MKKFYVLSILLFVLVACTHIDYARRLADADSLLYVRPDSALTLLRGIQPARLHTEEERMRHALLTVEAECRNRIPQRDDSLVKAIIHFARERDDEQILARAYYCQGLVNNSLKQQDEALVAFLQSEKYAHEVGNLKLLGRIYVNVGYIYQSNGIDVKGDSVYQLAAKTARQVGDSALLAESLIRQGMHRMGLGKEQYPVAKQLLLRAYQINKKTRLNKQGGAIAMSLSNLYGRMQQVDSAIYYAQQAIDLCENDTIELHRAQYFLGNAFSLSGQTDSARYYYEQSSQTSFLSIKMGAYMQLAKIAKNEKNWELAVKYQEQANRYKEEFYVSSQETDIISAQKDLEVNKKLLLIQDYQQIILWIIPTFLITIGICLFLLFKIRKQKTPYESVREDLSSKEFLLHHTQTNTKEVEEYAEKRTYTEDVFESCQQAIQQSELYRKIQRIVNYQKEHPGKNPAETFDATEREQFVSEVNVLIPGYVERLRERYPELNDIDIFILCLCLIGMSIPHIAYVMNRTRDNVYKRLRAIRKEKMGITSGDNSVNEVLQACKQI